MNWLLLVTLIIIGGSAIHGYQKGIIRMAISVFSIILSIVVSFVLAPMISDSLCNSEIVLSYVSDMVNEGLGIEKSCVDLTDNMVNNIKGTKKDNTTSVSAKQKRQMIQNLTLPEKIKDSMLENTAQIVGTKGKVTAINFAKAMSDYIARLVINVLAYIGIFIILKVAFRILIIVFKIVDRVPVIEDMNELLGGIAGAISGLLIVWVGFLVLLLFSTTSFGVTCYQWINDSKILTFLYNNNLLVHWLIDSVI